MGNKRGLLGPEFFEILLWPAGEKLLRPASRERLLDIACGNGLTSRRLASAGTNVTAFDGSAAMIDLARQHPGPPNIDYRVVDATDREALFGLGVGVYDGALCNMALMDIADIEPLMDGLAELLEPGGRFVFSVVHPCFNNPAAVQMGELEDGNGTLATTYSVKIARYITPFTQVGLAMPGQPVAHPCFHRPLSLLLAPALAAGLVLDGFEERAFPPEKVAGTSPLSWNGYFSEIPPALIVRLRRPNQSKSSSNFSRSLSFMRYTARRLHNHEFCASAIVETGKLTLLNPSNERQCVNRGS